MTKNYISNKDETVRMFQNDFFELFSKVPFWVPLFIYIPVIIIFLYRSTKLYNISNYNTIASVLFGILLWTVSEYMLHRFIFHYTPKTNLGKRIHFIFHGVHHDYPRDSKRLVMPPSVSLPLSTLFYSLFFYMFGQTYTNPIFAGFMIGYLTYDMTHYAVHHLSSNNRFFQFIKKHHMKHHYQDFTKGFGVSQPIWDYLMGTNFDEKSKKNV